MPYDEAYLAELKKQIRLENYKKRWRTRRANIKAKKPKGVWRGLEKYTFERCLREYADLFEDIVDVVMATCRSQTIQSHSNEKLVYMSQKILYLHMPFDARCLDREDIEQDLRHVWWIAYVQCRKKNWSTKSNFISYASFFLPRHIGVHITPVNRSNTNEVSYMMDTVPSFDIDIDYVVNGSPEWPMSLLDNYERYIVYLMSHDLDTYVDIANLALKSPSTVKKDVKVIQERLIKELDLNASSYTTRLS